MRGYQKTLQEYSWFLLLILLLIAALFLYIGNGVIDALLAKYDITPYIPNENAPFYYQPLDTTSPYLFCTAACCIKI